MDEKEHAGKGSVLLVDDTVANLKLLAKILRDDGYEVRPFPSGPLALKAAENQPPDLILLDIMMPDMDGYEVCRRLKESERLAGIPVIFLSALADTENKVRALEGGGVDYITKPFQAQEVLARVRAHVALNRLHTDLRQKYQELQELESLRDSLTHMIVHDLRSPLSGILINLQMLQMDQEKFEEGHREDIAGALASGAAMMEMITSLLDVNRMEAGEMPLKMEACAVDAVAREATESLGGLMGGCALTVEVPEGPVETTCDREIVRRIIANLVSNARRFTPGDGAITVAVEATPSAVRVEVRDQGPGIAEEDRGRIFEKFGQVEASARTRSFSTGLGLAFCKLGVEAHHGAIGVDSEVGQGSTFWFELPVGGGLATRLPAAEG